MKNNESPSNLASFAIPEESSPRIHGWMEKPHLVRCSILKLTTPEARDRCAMNFRVFTFIDARSCVPFPFPTVPNLNTELIETVERSSTGNSAVLPPRLTLRNLREGKFLQFQTLLFSLRTNFNNETRLKATPFS